MAVAANRRALATPLALAATAALAGAAAAIYYGRLGLTLAHYDARGHLVVARRIVDSITPGWQQIGAVWLPLPHLLNMFPVQVDAWYQSGASAVAISIVSFAAAVGALSWIAQAATGSRLAAVATALVFALNPNVLYLQATPMTEPLLIALAALGVALLMAWCRDADAATAGGSTSGTAAGVVLALACLTRYEAWPVTVSALTAAAWVRARAGEPPGRALLRVARIASVPAGAIAAFMVFSRIVVGEWFVSSGFFVPDNPVQGRPFAAALAIWWGAHELSGYGLATAGAIGLCVLTFRGLVERGCGWLVVPAALVTTAALPWSAFVDGHPYRIRYMVPLIAAQAVGVGVLADAAARSVRRSIGIPAAAFAVAALLAAELRPLDASAPMLVEAQWDRPNAAGRDTVTACLARGYAHDTIMASMGSLGHYMQDLSHAGFALRDFLHEGNGDIWLAALVSPRPFAGWILVEEQAEGGDMLAKAGRENPAFFDGFSRVCEGAGVALYQRQNRMLNVPR